MAKIPDHLAKYDWYGPHLAWQGFDVPFEPRRANLRGANLSGSSLCGADLTHANLRDANLSGSSLCGANLIHANLTHADLRDANLSGSSLCGADLIYADLIHANLTRANLRGADLTRSDLRHTNLRHTNLCGTGIKYVSVGFSGHGECGRTLLLVDVPGEGLVFFCGCFRGSPSELRDFAAKGQAEYRASRTRAMDICLELIDY